MYVLSKIHYKYSCSIMVQPCLPAPPPTNDRWTSFCIVSHHGHWTMDIPIISNNWSYVLFTVHYSVSIGAMCKILHHYSESVQASTCTFFTPILYSQIWHAGWDTTLQGCQQIGEGWELMRGALTKIKHMKC